MKHFATAVLTILTLAGCVTNPIAKYAEEAKIYIAETRPKALGGSVTWSSYYQGGLALAEKIPAGSQGRVEQVSEWVESLNMAKEFEAGRISKEDFFKWREEGNATVIQKNAKAQQIRTQCEYEARAAAAGVRDTGRSGINFDQLYKERELFELCVRAKQ